MKQLKIKLPLRTLALAGGLLLATSSFAQSNAIKGHVKDASGEPVMGATITVKGKAVGITDIDGNFSIDAAPGTELTFTFLGMSPQTVKASGNMTVTMSNDDKQLNEVVVIGYGTVKKNDLTGSINTVKPSEVQALRKLANTDKYKAFRNIFETPFFVPLAKQPCRNSVSLIAKRRFIFVKRPFVRIDRRSIFPNRRFGFYLLACYTAK